MSLTYEQILNHEDQPAFQFSGCDLVACVVYQAIKCKSYPTLPRKVDVIVKKVTEIYKREFKKVSEDFYCKDFGGYSELKDWLKAHIMTIPEIIDMNLSQAEFEAGISVDDESRGKYHFASRNSPAVPEKDDFIDLGAYAGNLAHDLIRNRICINFSTFPGSRYYEKNLKNKIPEDAQ